MSSENPKPKRGVGRPKGAKDSKPRAEKPSPLDGLNTKQALYVQGKLENKSDFQAAVDAGYSGSTALNAARNIERSPAVRRAFQHLLHQVAPLEKVARRAGEMLDATRKSYFSFEGRVTDERTEPDFVERRRGIALFSQMADYWHPKVTTEIEHTMSEETAKRLADICERMPLPPERAEELRQSYIPLPHDNHTNFGDKALLLEAPREPREPREPNELTPEQAKEIIPDEPK